MKRIRLFREICSLAIAATLTLGVTGHAAAHCDTMDGPVIQDARKALEAGDVTPVLKWVRAKDEKAVKQSFNKAVSAKGKKQQEALEKKFFESLVKIHRASEGAPYTGLKPAGEVEPTVAEADKALAGGSPDALVKLVADAVSEGIRHRYHKTAEAFRHRDESVRKGREFVAAYVEYTHYVERLHMDASGAAAHHGESAHKEHKEHREHKAPEHQHGHEH